MDFLKNLTPVEAILALGNVGQFVYAMKKDERWSVAVTNLTVALTQISERLKGGEK